MPIHGSRHFLNTPTWVTMSVFPPSFNYFSDNSIIA